MSTRVYTLIFKIVVFYCLFFSCTTNTYYQELARKRKEKESNKERLLDGSQKEKKKNIDLIAKNKTRDAASKESEVTKRDNIERIGNQVKKEETNKRYLSFVQKDLPETSRTLDDPMLHVYDHEIAVLCRYKKKSFNNREPDKTIIYFFNDKDLNDHSQLVLDVDFFNVSLGANDIVYLERHTGNLVRRSRDREKLDTNTINLNLSGDKPISRIGRHPNLKNNVLILRDNVMRRVQRQSLIIESLSLETFEVQTIAEISPDEFYGTLAVHQHNMSQTDFYQRLFLGALYFGNRPWVLKNKSNYFDLKNESRSLSAFLKYDVGNRIESGSNFQDYFINLNEHTAATLHIHREKLSAFAEVSILDSLHNFEPIIKTRRPLNVSTYFDESDTNEVRFFEEFFNIIFLADETLSVLRVDYDELLRQADRDFIFIASQPPRFNLDTSEWEYSIRALSRKKVSFKLIKAPAGSSITRKGKLTWRHDGKVDLNKYFSFVIQVQAGDITIMYGFEI